MARALINVPKTAKRGQVIEIKTLISHIMETGFRRTETGQIIPRNILTELLCTYNGEEIFRATITFFTVAKESGKIVFKWTGDRGFEQTETASITVEG
jgi:sulfur-oxidizing protein SoxZ